MPRYFRLSEAEAMLPHVEQALRDALLHKSEYENAAQELERLNDRIRMAGGSRVNPSGFLALRARRDTSAAALKDAIERIQSTGAFLKDLNLGLVDFLARYHGEEVCLCWRLGESKIEYWHGMEEGFRGRKRIDEDFLQNHRGEKTN